MPRAIAKVGAVVRIAAIFANVPLRFRVGIDIGADLRNGLLDARRPLNHLIRTVLQREQFFKFQIAVPHIGIVDIHEANFFDADPAPRQKIILKGHVVDVNIIHFRGAFNLHDVEPVPVPVQDVNGAVQPVMDKGSLRDILRAAVYQALGLFGHCGFIRIELHKGIRAKVIPRQLAHLNARGHDGFKAEIGGLLRHMLIQPQHFGTLDSPAIP